MLKSELIVVLGDGGAIGPKSYSAELCILLPKVGFKQFGGCNEAQDRNISRVQTAVVHVLCIGPIRLTSRRQLRLRHLPEFRFS